MPQKAMKQTAKLEKKDFKIFYGDVSYFHRVFGIHNQYELCLEPCLNGFEVALYQKDLNGIAMNLIGEKRCTNEQGYGDDYMGAKPRTDETWQKALEIANKLIELRLPKGVER